MIKAKRIQLVITAPGSCNMIVSFIYCSVNHYICKVCATISNGCVSISYLKI